jgi:succinate dehydrogenase / fumarate reductase, iron-sulfur subunit
MMKITLHIWRQSDADSAGDFETHEMTEVSEHMSFLEMLDVLNERLEVQGKEAVAFESDCREGICGACGFVINGVAHGHEKRTTVCQLHMRMFNDGDHITLEPWRVSAFPVQKDLVVDRSAFDRIIQSGGYISARTGVAQDANAIPVGKDLSDRAFDAATCIGCGACVAACPNGSAMLFTGAKVTHLNILPQGEPERYQRAQKMVDQMDSEDFGHCSNFGECTVVCPKGIPLDVIGQMNADFIKAQKVLRDTD